MLQSSLFYAKIETLEQKKTSLFRILFVSIDFIEKCHLSKIAVFQAYFGSTADRDFK